MLEPRPVAEPMFEQQTSLLSVVRDYLTLTKPAIILLLIITATGGMFLAARGVPPLSVMGLVWLGGALASGGASALNHYLDRDIDRLMSRTRQRPVADQRISPPKALLFGVALNLLAFGVLALGVNLLAAALTLGATLFYVFVYTVWLKRTTPQNIVIGGAAGSVPPLVGWAAVTGGLDLPAVYLFAIVFFWTPPHFWALSLLLQRDYQQAGIPMLPVVSGRDYTILNIFLYSLLVVALTLMLPFISSAGWVYLGSAALLGGGFLGLTWRLQRGRTSRQARIVYLYSLAYLALLFVGVMVDSAVPL